MHAIIEIAIKPKKSSMFWTGFELVVFTLLVRCFKPTELQRPHVLRAVILWVQILRKVMYVYSFII